MLWLPDVKYWLIWKDPNGGKDWRREEKGKTEDEMDMSLSKLCELVMDSEAWHATVHGLQRLDTTKRLNWTELKGFKVHRPDQRSLVLWVEHMCPLCPSSYVKALTTPPWGLRWHSPDLSSIQGPLTLVEWLRWRGWQGENWRKQPLWWHPRVWEHKEAWSKGEGRRSSRDVVGPPLLLPPDLGDPYQLSPSPWAVLASLLSPLLDGSGGESRHRALVPWGEGWDWGCTDRTSNTGGSPGLSGGLRNA